MDPVNCIWAFLILQVVSYWFWLEINSQSLQISVRLSEKMKLYCSMRASPVATSLKTYCHGGVFKTACSHSNYQLMETCSAALVLSAQNDCTPLGKEKGISNYS